jgi:endonuclease-3 related protein
MEAATEAGQSLAGVMSSKPKTKRSRTSAPLPATPAETIREIYRKLSLAWGEQHWWPAESPFEVIAGAILTQNTSWTNVEKALHNLRDVDALSVEGIRDVPLLRLEELIRPSGYFRQKAQRLKNFVAFLDARYEGSLERMFSVPTEELRAELLSQNGIGPETADAILLYAGHHEAFVVDAYARRILERHQVIDANTKYNELRKLVERALREEKFHRPSSNDLIASRPVAHAATPMSSATRTEMAQIYNEMHGLIVQVGKHYCSKRRPNCADCPLGAMLSPDVRGRLMNSEESRDIRSRRRN